MLLLIDSEFFKENVMPARDTCCTLVPYFLVAPTQLDAFKTLCEQFVEKTRNEPECLFYAFSFMKNQAHCREGYKNAEALLNHLDNVGALLEQALQISELERLELHGPEEELAKLREPLAAFNPQFFVLREDGFRR
jgi:quinol monooxygenase YgiN